MTTTKVKEPDKAKKAEAPSQKAKQQPTSLQAPAYNPMWQRLAQGVQAKLAVSAPDDSYEREADRVADQVMRMPAPSSAVTDQTFIAGQAPVQDEVVRAKVPAAAIMPLVQYAPSGSPGTRTPGAGFESRLNIRSGSPLPVSIRAFMEPRFGTDLSGVRLHGDRESAQLNRAISAQAFTYGRDIYLGEGKNDIESNAGKRLLAHELTHTIQQGAAGVTATRTISARVQRQPATRNELLAAFRNALARQDWADAAVRLNGFSSEDIEVLVGRMGFGQLAHVREAALIAMPGWSSRVTEAIDRADASAGRIAAFYAQYEAAVAAAQSGRTDWGEVAKLLNGMGDWDIADRLKRFTWFELMKLKDAAGEVMPGYSGRVVKAVEKADLERVKRVYRAYDEAIANQDWARVAVQLNGFSEDEIVRRIVDLADSDGGIRKLGFLKAAALRLMPDHYGRIVGPIDQVLTERGAPPPDIIPYQESIPIPDVSDDKRSLEGTSLEGFGGNAKIEEFCRKLAALYGSRVADKQLDENARKAAAKDKVPGAQIDDFLEQYKADRSRSERKAIADTSAASKFEILGAGFVSTGPIAKNNMGYKTFAGYARDWMSEMRELVDAETIGSLWYGKFRLPSTPSFATQDLVDIVKPGTASGGAKVYPFVNEFITALGAAGVRFSAGTYPNHGGKEWAPFCLDVNPVIGKDERGLYQREPAMEFLEQVNAVVNRLRGDWAGCYNDAALCDAANKRFGANRVSYAGKLGTGNWHGALKLHFHFYLVPPKPPAGAPTSARSGPILNPANEPHP